MVILILLGMLAICAGTLVWAIQRARREMWPRYALTDAQRRTQIRVVRD